MNSLYQQSLELIIGNQSQNGAFVACPNFKTYQYAWFRDGSFCAYALIQAGYAQNARRFFDWTSTVIQRYQQKIKTCISAAQEGTPPPAEDCFHSRFTLEGFEVPGKWGHHQLDGLGTWLWALREYFTANPAQAVPETWRVSAALVCEYLSVMWKFPCSDSWEENENDLHTYTLASVAAGLQCYANLFHVAQAGLVSAEIVRFIRKNCVADGTFTKSVGARSVDANLIALVHPLRIVEWDDPIFQKTLAKINRELASPIGLHRYLQDTYYGSGEWILLTDWLGWAYAENGEPEKAGAILEWTESMATLEGELAEQIPHGLFAGEEYGKWLDYWGPIASPLLWSHAMYMLLFQSLNEKGKQADD